MQIKSVAVATPIGEKYEIGDTVNGVVIDDIIRNTETGVVYCYDAGSNVLVEISAMVPRVIEFIYEGETVNA